MHLLRHARLEGLRLQVGEARRRGGHFHNNCRRKVIPEFGGISVEDYDPSKWYARLVQFKAIDSGKDFQGVPFSEIEKKALKLAFLDNRSRYESVLKDIDHFSIPEAKLVGYALNSENDPNKARAFKGYLGYEASDTAEVASRVYEFVVHNSPKFKSSNKYGDLYTTDMVMVGKGGKSAKVRAGWITDAKTVKMRLTTVFVDE